MQVLQNVTAPTSIEIALQAKHSTQRGTLNCNACGQMAPQPPVGWGLKAAHCKTRLVKDITLLGLMYLCIKGAWRHMEA